MVQSVLLCLCDDATPNVQTGKEPRRCDIQIKGSSQENTFIRWGLYGLEWACCKSSSLVHAGMPGRLAKVKAEQAQRNWQDLESSGRLVVNER